MRIWVFVCALVLGFCTSSISLAQDGENPRAMALKEIRAALAARDLPQIKTKLEAAAKLKGMEPFDTELFRLEQLGTYVTQFWQAVDRAGKTMQATDIRELKIGDTIGAFVEYENGTLVVRINGQNRSYTRQTMPPKIALVMAEHELDPKAAGNKVFFGAFAAMDGKGDRKVAKQYWDEAAAAKIDVKHLLPELEVPRAAPAVVIPALTPLAKNLLQPKNWSLRVKGPKGWVKKPVGDAGKQNDDGWLIVQTPADGGEVQLVFTRPLTPNFGARIYLEGVKKDASIGLVSVDGDEDALLTELPAGTVVIEFARQAGQLKARVHGEEAELVAKGKGTAKMQALLGIVVPAGTQVTVASLEVGLP
jgi:hypothetical protein